MRNPITLTHAALTGIVQQVQDVLYHNGTTDDGRDLFDPIIGMSPVTVYTKLRQAMRNARLEPAHAGDTREDGFPPLVAEGDHSPGPWQTNMEWYEPVRGHHVLYVYGNDRQDGAIAQVWRHGTAENRVEMTEANARLIAAGPTLREVCTAAATWVDENAVLIGDAGARLLLDRLNAAIELAGGSPVKP